MGGGGRVKEKDETGRADMCLSALHKTNCVGRGKKKKGERNKRCADDPHERESCCATSTMRHSSWEDSKM